MFSHHPMQGLFVWMFRSHEHGWPRLFSYPCLLLSLSWLGKYVWTPMCFWEPLKVFVSPEFICSLNLTCWYLLRVRYVIKIQYISDEPFSFSIPFSNIFIPHSFHTIDHSRFLKCITRIDLLVIWEWRDWAGGSVDTGLSMKTWRPVGVSISPLPEARKSTILQGQGSQLE